MGLANLLMKIAIIVNDIYVNTGTDFMVVGVIIAIVIVKLWGLTPAVAFARVDVCAVVILRIAVLFLFLLMLLLLLLLLLILLTFIIFFSINRTIRCK